MFYIIILKIQFYYLEFISRYYYSSRFFYQIYIRQSYQKNCKRILFEKHNKLYNDLVIIISEFNFEEKDSLTFWGDSLFLLNFYLNKKPKYTLELGSGSSSLTLAYGAMLIKKKYGINSYIYSIDENEKYLKEVVIQKFPDYLNEFINFSYSKTILNEYDGNLGISFKAIPNVKFDFAYVDGPQFKPNVYNNSKYSYEEKTISNLSKKPFNADIIDILKKSKNLVVVIDQRISTVWTIIKLTKNKIKSKKYYFAPKKTVIFYK